MSLTANEIASMITAVAEPMPDTCVISSPSRTSDGAGGGTITYSPVTGGTVSCRFDPYTYKSDVDVIAGAETYVFNYIGTFPYNAPLASDSHITHSSKTYEITSFISDKSWQLCIKAYLSEVGGTA